MVCDCRVMGNGKARTSLGKIRFYFDLICDVIHEENIKVRF